MKLLSVAMERPQWLTCALLQDISYCGKQYKRTQVLI